MRQLNNGTQLANRYTLIRRLGVGGAAETWLASDKMTRASVALKILVDDGGAADTLRREWQLSIRLMHAHIVRVFEFHDDPDGPFYSLQFVDGPNISVLSGAPLEDSLPPIALLADALRYAHGKGVVHRDIKASNILLDRNGAPYLIDFGVAASGGTDISGGSRGGSLIAASPQQLDGAAAQPADDIFALGGLIYELVSGHSPYSSSATADDIRNSVPPPLLATDGRPVSPKLQQLVARMLDKKAEERPDAETVTAGLAAAGFSAAAAPSRYAGGAHAARDEVITKSESIRVARRHAPPPPPPVQAGEGGISPKTLGISLVALVLMLIGVVFILPKTVTTDNPRAVTTQDDEALLTDRDQRKGRSRVGFSENVEDLSGRDERVRARVATEAILGELLSKIETLERRAVQRWGGLRFKRAQAVYAEGDQAYLARDYATAGEKYNEAIEIVEPLLDDVDRIFARTLTDAQTALDSADTIEALRQFELAVAISPSHAVANAGLQRARNLDTVLSLIDQGLVLEEDLELDAAQQNFARAVEIDPAWEPAQVGLERVLATINQMDFDQRMTEGLEALALDEFLAARAAFRMAQSLKPESPEPADGLMQVDQGIRLSRIGALQRKARSLERGEQWDDVVETYDSILSLDGDLAFAHEGLRQAQQMAALHKRLDKYIADPDSLSAPATMQAATRLVVDITRMPVLGSRLSDQRDELSRLLKRAATPLTVQLVSDSLTNVSIYRVGRLGSFDRQEVNLLPGTYVAVGSRSGYRDVRLEFRVAPEIDMQPIIVRCEEQI
jgi:tetratricopeptide (TPR) repeat protein